MKTMGTILLILGVGLLLWGGVIGIDTGSGGIRVTNLSMLTVGSTSTIVGAIFLSIGLLADRISLMTENLTQVVRRNKNVAPMAIGEDDPARKFASGDIPPESPAPHLLQKLAEDDCSVVWNSKEWVLTKANGTKLMLESLEQLETYVEKGYYK